MLALLPVAEDEIKTFGFFFNCNKVSTNNLVPVTLESNILFFFESDHLPRTLKGPSKEPEAMFSPAKCITASTPSNALEST